jgi:hypothetical protein
MNKIFNEASVTGIIEPGQLYIFDQSAHRGWSPGPIEYLFCIKEDKEILMALDMEYSIVLAEYYDLIEFLGVRKISKNCHQFRMLVYDKDSGRKSTSSFYLHRIIPFDESFKKIKRLFKKA